MKGSCLCGGIAYESGDLIGPIGHCHCKTCRKAHGAAFATTSRVARSAFRWISGVELLGSFESSPGKHRHVCSRCGTRLMAEWEGQDFVILRLGALDTDPDQVPAGHIWMSHAVPWLDYGPELPMYPEGAPQGNDSR
ncbi:MAG TPA: GFA family protein [Pseudomonadales bacterium]